MTVDQIARATRDRIVDRISHWTHGSIQGDQHLDSLYTSVSVLVIASDIDLFNRYYLTD